jgi:hypothetical protein
LTLADQFAGVAGQDLDQAPFGAGEPCLAAAVCCLHDSVCEVHCVLSDANGVERRGVRGPAAGNGADAGEELIDAERFGDVVVGAGIEGGDLVATAGAAGEHDDGCRAPAAEAANDVDAVHVG